MPGRRITPHRRDRIGVRPEIPFGVGLRPRRLAQHVEARGKAFMLRLAHPLHRFVDRAAHHEDFAHHPHRGAHRLPHERLAGAADQAAQRRLLFPLPHQRTPDDQPPGRRIDQGRVRLAGMCAPIGIAQFVGDQQIRRLRIGHAQERLGQRQQRHALGRIKPIFLQELVDPPLALRRAQIRQQPGGVPKGALARLGGQRGTLQQRL